MNRTHQVFQDQPHFCWRNLEDMIECFHPLSSCVLGRQKEMAEGSFRNVQPLAMITNIYSEIISLEEKKRSTNSKHNTFFLSTALLNFSQYIKCFWNGLKTLDYSRIFIVNNWGWAPMNSVRDSANLQTPKHTIHDCWLVRTWMRTQSYLICVIWNLQWMRKQGKDRITFLSSHNGKIGNNHWIRIGNWDLRWLWSHLRRNEKFPVN